MVYKVMHEVMDTETSCPGTETTLFEAETVDEVLQLYARLRKLREHYPWGWGDVISCEPFQHTGVLTHVYVKTQEEFAALNVKKPDVIAADKPQEIKELMYVNGIGMVFVEKAHASKV